MQEPEDGSVASYAALAKHFAKKTKLSPTSFWKKKKKH